MSLHPQIRQQLADTAGMPVYLWRVPGLPDATPYLLVRPAAGVASPHRLHTTSRWVEVPVDVLAVASTVDGCLAAASRVRQALDGWRVYSTASPAREISSSPILVEGQDTADPRYTLTITYRIYARLEDTL